MIIPIKCFTCGNILASKYKKYEELMNAEELYLTNDNKIFVNKKNVLVNYTTITNQEKYNRLQNFLNNNNEKKPIEAIILDNLGLKRYCCRRHFIGHVDVEL